MTFPLLKQKPKIALTKIEGQTEEDIKRIASSSVTNIIFSRGSDGNIKVKEAQYVPELSYLRNRNFDIRDDIGKGFSGNIIIKYRSRGTTEVAGSKNKDAQMAVFNKNMALPKGAVTRARSTYGDGYCFAETVCIYQQDCRDLFTISGDYIRFVREECGPWYETGECDIVEITCPYGEPGYDPGEKESGYADTPTPNDYLPESESCEPMTPESIDDELNSITDATKPKYPKQALPLWEKFLRDTPKFFTMMVRMEIYLLPKFLNKLEGLWAMMQKTILIVIKMHVRPGFLWLY